jgi:nucleotide-binding universal stress UspA family protein
MTERVLVAVDLSDTSLAPLAAARGLADERGATLAIVHVPASSSADPPLIPQSQAINMTRALELERIAHEALERRISEVDGFANVDRFFEIGPPHEGIVHRAKVWNADLVVVGSRGRSGVLRALLGSVAEQVVRAAHCDVLVSRPARGTKLVVAATDLSGAWLPTVARAGEEARLRSAPLVVIHVVDPPGSADSAHSVSAISAGSPAAQPPQWDLLLTLLADEARPMGTSAEAFVVEGDTVSSVLGAVDERGADLLVIGAQGPMSSSEGSLGRVADKLVRLASCSVLVVRTKV